MRRSPPGPSAADAPAERRPPAIAATGAPRNGGGGRGELPATAGTAGPPDAVATPATAHPTKVVAATAAAARGVVTAVAAGATVPVGIVPERPDGTVGADRLEPPGPIGAITVASSLRSRCLTAPGTSGLPEVHWGPQGYPCSPSVRRWMMQRSRNAHRSRLQR
jgi:hypothetical protein